MSDVFRAKFNGREWWAFDYQDHRHGTTRLHPKSSGPSCAGEATLIVPAHMVERIEDTPPEPTEPGTVLYDRDDVAWMWRVDALPAGWFSNKHGWWDNDALNRGRGPLHPYPKAARDEIDELQRRIDQAEEYITEPVDWCSLDARQRRVLGVLRGES